VHVLLEACESEVAVNVAVAACVDCERRWLAAAIPAPARAADASSASAASRVLDIVRSPLSEMRASPKQAGPALAARQLRVKAL